MPTQKRSLNICFQRGAAVMSARMALGCARKLVRQGDYKAAEGPLRATTESLKLLEYRIYVYDRESLETVRNLPSEIRKAVKVLRSKTADKAEKVNAVEKLNPPIERLHMKVEETCKGKLPGYASR